jgi:hypothetical protein
VNNHAILKAEREAGIAARDQNREIVLRYSDIAAKLKEPPLKCADPKTWSGCIPGPHHAESAGGVLRPNRSGIREQLLVIVMEAAVRADAEATPPPSPRSSERATAGA